MSEYYELSKALAEYADALADRAETLKTLRETVFGGTEESFPYYDPSEPVPIDEELERQSENRRAYHKPYDWLTEMED